MPGSLRIDGWRAIALVAITYVYFLIFAQFGFLARLDALGLTGHGLELVMAAMAAGGIATSLLAPRLGAVTSPILLLRVGLASCALAALLSLLPLGIIAAALVALLIGTGLGLLTVTLVTHLRSFTGERNSILKVGIGTGLGYFICNVPPIFTATPEHQAVLASTLCALGILATADVSVQATTPHRAKTPPLPFTQALLTFAALVWLDSAAFYIIQHTVSLKAGTWMGDSHLWTNASIHFLAAVIAALLLTARRTYWTLTLAYGCLASACILLAFSGLERPASLLYPAGVSLYSVALVAYPSFLTRAASPEQRARQAGLIYAVAGWIGSALGIGMGQHLGHVPFVFIAVSGAIVLLPALYQVLRTRMREAIVLAAVLIASYFISHSTSPLLTVSASATERGRQVYISEGCIHCHSQYVRPNTPDELMWGPIESLQALHSQRPPLIGNRRQGPDLTQVGVRRSPLWLKAHLIDPGEVSGGSIMPSYAVLFQNGRGDDLVAYLASLHSGDTEQHLRAEQTWRMEPSALKHIDVSAGEHLYRQHCATCHDPRGATRVKWQSNFKETPADLFTGPFNYLQNSTNTDARFIQLARIVKFGIHNTDMPGHEYLSDRDIASLTSWLMQHSTAGHP